MNLRGTMAQARLAEILRRGLVERLAQIATQVRILAGCGRYGGASSIEMALLAHGFVEARKVFANRWSRCELDRLCELARRHPAAHSEAA